MNEERNSERERIKYNFTELKSDKEREREIEKY